MRIAIPNKTTIRANVVPAAAAALIALFGGWALDRRAPVTVVAGDMRPQLVNVGDRAQIEWSIDVHRRCSAVVAREIVGSDEKLNRLVDYHLTPRTTGHQRMMAPFTVPALPPGEAYYRATAWYRCNPLHQWWPIEVRTQDVAFTVREPALRRD